MKVKNHRKTSISDVIVTFWNTIRHHLTNCKSARKIPKWRYEQKEWNYLYQIDYLRISAFSYPSTRSVLLTPLVIQNTSSRASTPTPAPSTWWCEKCKLLIRARWLVLSCYPCLAWSFLLGRRYMSDRRPRTSCHSAWYSRLLHPPWNGQPLPDGQDRR